MEPELNLRQPPTHTFQRRAGVPQDHSEAVKWYRKAAEQGIAEAQNNLGLSYAMGQGTPQNYAEAVKWFRKAANQGFAKAQANLGVRYAEGQGVLQDHAEAYVWISLSVANRCSQAIEIQDYLAKKLSPQALERAQARSRQLNGEILAITGKREK